MSIEPFPSQKSEVEIHPDKIFPGFMHIVQDPTQNYNVLEIDGYEVATNFSADDIANLLEAPSESDIFGHPYFRHIKPSGIDIIAAGQYFIKEPFIDPKADQQYVITEDSNGKYINCLKDDHQDNIGGSKILMEKLGFQYKQNGGVERFPSPKTIKAHAEKLGVNVQLFPDEGHLDGVSYLNVFANGRYPIATGKEEFYAHDTTDDHLTAVVLGGELLRDTLRDAAREALGGNDVANAAKSIDQFTAHLRANVAPTEVPLMGPISVEKLYEIGQQLGITEEKVDEILNVAKTNARNFEMEVKE